MIIVLHVCCVWDNIANSLSWPPPQNNVNSYYHHPQPSLTTIIVQNIMILLLLLWLKKEGKVVRLKACYCSFKKKSFMGSDFYDTNCYVWNTTATSTLLQLYPPPPHLFIVKIEEKTLPLIKQTSRVICVTVRRKAIQLLYIFHLKYCCSCSHNFISGNYTAGDYFQATVCMYALFKFIILIAATTTTTHLISSHSSIFVLA